MKRRYSKQRELIYNNLTSRHDHPDASMIYNDLKESHPELSLGTVYRNLNILVEQDLISQLGHDKKFAHYDGNINPHAHFICDECFSIYDFHDQAAFFNELIAQYDCGHQINSTEITLRGICHKCLEKKGERK
ncbi:MAG: transcriptional repressor [Erysipelotrichaceae bacterium]|nr:transcriptional repressor [Erysipelotrichaceae bacterium]